MNHHEWCCYSLVAEAEEHKAIVACLHATTNRQMWAEDLAAFEEAWMGLMDEDDGRAALMAKQQAAAQRNARKVGLCLIRECFVNVLTGLNSSSAMHGSTAVFLCIGCCEDQGQGEEEGECLVR